MLRHRKVLAVAAHPDDLEWYIGGTLRRLADSGADVQVVVATFGDQGPNLISASDLARTRAAEQLRAARINGYARVHFLGLPDKGVVASGKMPGALASIWRGLKPDMVLAFDPVLWSPPYLHPDHQGSGLIACKYWRSLPARARPALYLFQTRRPDTVVNISSVIDTKEKALNQHLTQNAGRAGKRNRIFSAGLGSRVGVAYAEGFRGVK